MNLLEREGKICQKIIECKMNHKETNRQTLPFCQALALVISTTWSEGFDSWKVLTVFLPCRQDLGLEFNHPAVGGMIQSILLVAKTEAWCWHKLKIKKNLNATTRSFLSKSELITICSSHKCRNPAHVFFFFEIKQLFIHSKNYPSQKTKCEKIFDTLIMKERLAARCTG